MVHLEDQPGFIVRTEAQTCEFVGFLAPRGQNNDRRLSAVSEDPRECRQFTGEIDNFGELEKDLKKSIRKALKMMCRESMMAVAACSVARLESDWDVCDDEVGNAFDGFLKTTMLGVRKDGVSRW